MVRDPHAFRVEPDRIACVGHGEDNPFLGVGPPLVSKVPSQLDHGLASAHGGRALYATDRIGPTIAPPCRTTNSRYDAGKTAPQLSCRGLDDRRLHASRPHHGRTGEEILEPLPGIVGHWPPGEEPPRLAEAARQDARRRAVAPPQQTGSGAAPTRTPSRRRTRAGDAAGRLGTVPAFRRRASRSTGATPPRTPRGGEDTRRRARPGRGWQRPADRPAVAVPRLARALRP